MNIDKQLHKDKSNVRAKSTHLRGQTEWTVETLGQTVEKLVMLEEMRRIASRRKAYISKPNYYQRRPKRIRSKAAFPFSLIDNLLLWIMWQLEKLMISTAKSIIRYVKRNMMKATFQVHKIVQQIRRTI